VSRARILIAPIAAVVSLLAASPAEAVTLQVAAVVVDTPTEGLYTFVITGEAVIVPSLTSTAGVVGTCQAVIVLPPSSANVRCWVLDETTGTRHYVATSSIDVGIPAIQVATGTTSVNTDHNLAFCVEATADGYTPPYQCGDFLP
jgi:hypothetical protein